MKTPINVANELQTALCAAGYTDVMVSLEFGRVMVALKTDDAAALTRLMMRQVADTPVPIQCDTVGCLKPATHKATANRVNNTTFTIYHCGVHLGPTICKGPDRGLVYTDIKQIDA